METTTPKLIKKIIQVLCSYRHWLIFLHHVLNSKTMEEAGLCRLFRSFKDVTETAPDWALMACITITTSLEAVRAGAYEQTILASVKDVILEEIASEIFEELER